MKTRDWIRLVVSWVAFAFAVSLIVFFANLCFGMDWEVSSNTGFGSHHGTSYWQETLKLKGTGYIYKGVYAGGQIDYTKYSFGHRGSVGFVFGLDWARLWSLTFYTEGFGGVAVKSGASELNAKTGLNTLGSGLCGIFGAETGVRIPLHKRTQLNIGIGYDHMSSFRSGDKGLNTFGPKIGIRW